jgi:hypothetical protein
MLIIMASQAHELLFIDHWPLLELEWDIPLATACVLPLKLPHVLMHPREVQANSLRVVIPIKPPIHYTR